MEEIAAALAALVTLGLPAVGQAVRRLRRGAPPTVASLTLDSGEQIDFSDPNESGRREQIDAVLESRAPPAVGSLASRPSLARQFLKQLNPKITVLQVVYGLVMVIGIAAKEVWDYNQTHGHLGFKTQDMAAALLVAPIVYTAVQPHIAPLHESLTLLGIGIAFQNGFFWQSVFANVQSGHG